LSHYATNARIPERGHTFGHCLGRSAVSTG
jgi:hypothetical protein